MHESRPDTRVPGFAVVIVTPKTGGPAWGELRQGDAEPLRGRAALAKAIAASGTDDPALLADLAVAFVDPNAAGKSVWQPGDAVMGNASPAAPSLDGRTLRYWRAHARLAELVKVKVDLDTGQASVSRAGETLGPDAAASELVDRARAAVQGGEVDAIRAALSSVAASDDRAATVFLGEFLATEKRPFLRRSAIESIGKSKPPEGDAVLGVVLLSETNKDVRRAAARALENWGRPEGARAALERVAASDSDVVVQTIAARALAKLQ